MFKLNLHARIEIAAVAALLLGSCQSDNPNSPERLAARIDDADVNARTAINAANDLEDRVSEIESRLNM